MHILLGLLGLLGAVGVILWRINMAAQATRELGDLAGEAANLPRKMRFRSKARRRGVDMIDDPREAAAALVYGAARAGGEVSQAARAEITKDLATLFGIDADQAAEIMARGVWHMSSLNDPVNAVNPLTNLLVDEVDREALEDVSQQINGVIERADPASPEQTYYLKKFRRRAGLES